MGRHREFHEKRKIFYSPMKIDENYLNGTGIFYADNKSTPTVQMSENIA